MITDGYIEVNIYKHRIKITVNAEYINASGRNDWMINYYYLEYHHRFFRWLYEKDVIERITKMADELGLTLRAVEDFKIIVGESPYSVSTINKFILFDIKNNEV